MSEYLTPSIVAALTSLIISLITLFQFFKNQRFQQKQFEKNLNRNLTNKLYELRLLHYPKAFEITDEIFKDKGGNYDALKLKKSVEDLIKWKKGVVDLIISNEAHASFYLLRDCLMKNPAHNSDYSKEQVDKISVNAKEFRRQLKRDLGFLFREEKERRRRNK